MGSGGKDHKGRGLLWGCDHGRRGGVQQSVHWLSPSWAIAQGPMAALPIARGRGPSPGVSIYSAKPALALTALALCGAAAFFYPQSQTVPATVLAEDSPPRIASVAPPFAVIELFTSQGCCV